MKIRKSGRGITREVLQRILDAFPDITVQQADDLVMAYKDIEKGLLSDINFKGHQHEK